jgi:hypothetical protein
MERVLATTACAAVTVPLLVLVAVKVLAMDMEIETSQSKFFFTPQTFSLTLSMLASLLRTLGLTGV